MILVPPDVGHRACGDSPSSAISGAILLRFQECLRPALPPAEPYGLLPMPSSPEPADEAAIQPRCHLVALSLASSILLALLAIALAASLLFVALQGETSSVFRSPLLESTMLGEVDDIPYSPEGSEDQAEAIARVEEFSLSPSSLDLVADVDGLTVFSLGEGFTPPVLPSSMEERIEDAISDIEDAGASVSCLFVDVESGLGYAYDVDEEIYGASSFKAPLASYVLSHIADRDGISSSDMSLVRASVEWSDNDAFASLSKKYRHSDEFDEWVADELSIADGKRLFRRGDFATYSARDGAKMWAFISDYLDGGTEGSCALAEFCESTNVSFIRDGVEAVADDIVEYDSEGEDGMVSIALAAPEEITVLNKAGWYPESSVSSTTDNAIIDVDGHRYIMCILTSLPYCDESGEMVSELAGELFSARGCLFARNANI